MMNNSKFIAALATLVWATSSFPTSFAWIGSLSPSRHCKKFALRSSVDDESSERTDSSAAASSLQGKTLYQRAFFRVSSAEFNEDVMEEPRAMVIEERLRYQVKDKPDFVEPVGPRTIVLRDGEVEEGKIGDVIATMHILPKDGTDHPGLVKSYESTYATALYLASNRNKYLHGKVLQLACAQDSDLGLATVLGCIGAASAQQKEAGEDAPATTSSSDGGDVDDDILTIPTGSIPILPKEMIDLTLSDGSDMQENVEWMMANLKAAKIIGSDIDAKVSVQENLNWNVRKSSRGSAPKEYNTIVASDLSFTFPEAKELARTVANHLEPAQPYYISANSRGQPIPKFLYVCNEARDNVSYLNKFLEQGYKMSVVNDMFEMECIRFTIQTIDTVENGAQEEAALDDLALQVQEMYDSEYHLMTALHHPDYTGGGSGELFFPMETGQYDERSGETYLEREPGFDKGGGWLG
eukprot:CAMPEP_0198152976 /NCGR_PEP_ID=MMETSP1443-20131203/62023_1 /TAXON_ID=186043 /ORGANISM="Entomoneis sp., Strain CCMP2396" /LENGTH=466 /DNA_ID=CAMNT_0043819143 /DNA_START=94 /DNA_END=1494 /DNA_ORIENTATION=-